MNFPLYLTLLSLLLLLPATSALTACENLCTRFEEPLKQAICMVKLCKPLSRARVDRYGKRGLGDMNRSGGDSVGDMHKAGEDLGDMNSAEGDQMSLSKSGMMDLEDMNHSGRYPMSLAKRGAGNMGQAVGDAVPCHNAELCKVLVWLVERLHGSLQE